MKNVFAYDLTGKNGNDLIGINGTCFITMQTDEALREEYERAYMTFSKEEKRIEPPFHFYLLITVLGIIGYCLLIYYSTHMEDYQPWHLFAIVLVVVVIVYVLDKKEKGYVPKGRKEESYRRAFGALESALAEVHRQLRVPQETEKADVIFYTYKLKNGREHIQGTSYINMEIPFFVQEGRLCMICGTCRLEILLSDIKGIRRVKKRLAMSNWNKKTPYNKGQYKKYKITRNNIGVYWLREYYVMSVESLGEEWEIYIAPYDLEQVQRLTGIAVY